ncbi:MAG: ComF family protein [Pseudomonadota bacterium]|jgi:ComF family protein
MRDLSIYLTDGAGKLGALLVNALLPPRCLASGEIVTQQGLLGAAAWSRIHFITSPFCERCGVPFSFDTGDGGDILCGACIAKPPLFDRARAVFHYDDGSRPMILGFKHGDRLEGVPAFARWMAQASAECLQDRPLIVPAPLHRKRLFRRRYNQSALLALALGRLTGAEVSTDALRRVRNTPPQGGLNRAARERNLRGAIEIRQRRKSLVQGRNILLVDDVLTTGATAEACARALRRAGAKRVDVSCLARVVRPG